MPLKKFEPPAADLTFDDAPFERSVIGKTVTSELWMDGRSVTKSEHIKGKKPQISAKEQTLMREAVEAQKNIRYDAGFMSWQPVEGRSVSARYFKVHHSTGFLFP